ncbi:MAG: hypothetical protein IID48_14875 [Proteobacteria bacterium]|nr:hypothetical protein [Pseudomonadota bacterium]
MSEWTTHPAATLFPLLEGSDFEALVTDIREHGLREAMWLDLDGRVLDGRNRLRACEAADVEPRFRRYEGDDPLGFVLSLNLHRRHLNESQRAMVAARVATLGRGQRQDRVDGSIDLSTAGEFLNVSGGSIKRARVVQEHGGPELVQAVDQALVTVSDAAAVAKESHTTQRASVGAVQRGEANNLKTAKVRRDIERQRLEIAEGRTDLPEGVFQVIVIDPPWPYDTKYDPTHWLGRSACRYPDMSIAELEALELPADKNCVLWLWTTNGFMGEACDLLKAWGFQRKTILTWVKPRIGTGRWLRNRTEHCLLAVKGSPKVSLTNQSTVLEAPAREHSRKPDEFYDLVDSLCVGRTLDYFSREPRPGWAQLGNDVAKFGGAA